MPQAIAVTVWIALMDVGLSVAVAQAVMTVLTFIATTAASMAASKLLAPKSPSYADSSLVNRNQTVRSPIAARQIIYGQCKVGGTLVYISTTGTKNEYLHLVIAFAGHEVEKIGAIYFNDEEALAENDPGSAATGRFAGYADIFKKLGSDTQTVQTDLETATASLTDGKWTSNHRLRGIAYVYVKLIWSEQVWASGIPNITAVIKGKKVYDPRTGLTAYSTNSALCLRDYMTDTRLGLGMDSSEMDDTAFSAAANICEEQVQILPLSPTTYENRYATNGTLSTAATPDENIGKLLSSMAGLMAYSGGKIVPYAGGYRIPTVSLSEKHFVGPVSVQTRTSARDRVNAVKGVYVSPENNWQVTDFPPLVSSVYYAEDNSIRYWRDVVLPLTTSPAAAQRLSVIELRRARQEVTMTARFRLEAMQVRAGDTVMISNAKYGWTDKVFEVIEWHFATDGNPPQLSIDMTLRETASSVYSWTVSDEIDVPFAPDTTLPNPYSLNGPTNLTLTADGTTQLIQADGTAMPRILVAWSAPSEQFIQAGGMTLIEYKQGNSTTYLTWLKIDGDKTRDYISSDIKIGTSYDVRLSGESYFGVSTSYVTASITVAKDTTAPAVPTSLTASVGTGKAVSLDWADNTEPDFSEYGVYRNTTGTTPSSIAVDKIAEVRASRFVDTEVTIGTTYYYWINAFDLLQNVSGFTSAVTAVPTYVGGGSVDPTAPGTPSAMVFSAETTYLGTDGTAFARISLTAPALPTGAVSLDVLYRRNGSSDWLLANSVTGTRIVSIDDLTCGQSYDFAARGISFSGVQSATSTVLTRTAPAYSTTPTPPSGTSFTNNGVKPKYFPGTQTFLFGTRIGWNKNIDADFSYFEIKATATDTDGAVDYTWDTYNGTTGTTKTTETEVYFYASTPVAGYIRMRSVNRSGVASAWVRLGNANTSAAYGAGTMAAQDSTNVTTTGIKTGGGSSTRQVNVVYDTNEVVSVTGTGSATSVTVPVSIANRGFSAKPDVGVVVAQDTLYQAVYDYDDAGNSSTTAVLKFFRNDGGIVGTGPVRISANFIDYT